MWRSSRHRFEIKWTGQPLEHWAEKLPSHMTSSMRCVICDLAWELGKSEEQFFEAYRMEERAQLLATYRSRMSRAAVMAEFPVKRDDGSR